jgi:hypothetical protein
MGRHGYKKILNFKYANLLIALKATTSGSGGVDRTNQSESLACHLDIHSIPSQSPLRCHSETKVVNSKAGFVVP